MVRGAKLLRLLARLRRGRRPWGVLEDETRWVQGLLDLAQGMSSEGSFDTRLGEVCRVARELIGCDRSSIFLLEDGAYRAKFNAGNPPHVAKLFPSHQVRLDDPLISRAVETRSFVVANDASRSPLVNPRLARAAGIRAIVVAPVLAEDDAPLGFMTAEYNQTVGTFSTLQSRLLLGLARLVAITVAGHRAREERARLENRVQSLERLEAIGRLAGGVAHDFNNLLTVVLGNAEILEPELPDGARPALEELQGAAHRAASLTQRLLAFGQRQVLRPSGVDLHRLTEALEPLLRRLLPESIDIELHGREGRAVSRVDPGEFEQVVMNLVLNARDAMPSGGRLTIETERVTLDDEYCRDHPGVAPGAYALLAVSDTGAGLPRAAAEHVFEPFFSTRPVRHGGGLGLATVYGIVQQSQGHIWLYSELGKGTTFRVYLPWADKVEPRPADPPAPTGPATGDETVLVVDDDPAVRRVAVVALERQGYRVLEASHPDEAQRIAEEHEGTIHLLLTDVVMPDSSGSELAESVRRARPGIRVLYVSGYTENAITHQGALDRGVAYLSKPFTPNGLVRRVRQELDIP